MALWGLHTVPAHSEGEIHPSQIAGLWEGYGYFCTGPVPVEIIEISVEGDSVTATKLDGDPCVPSGHKTWEGTMVGNTITGHFYVSRGPNTEIFKAPSQSTFIVVDPDTIQVEGGAAINFKRLPTVQEDDAGLFTN